MRLFISSNIMGILNSTTARKAPWTNALYIICVFPVLTPCPSYPTQKEAVPGLEPEKNWSGARQCQAPDETTNCTIICRRRQELRVSAYTLAWLFEYILLHSYPIVHDPSLMSLATPKEYCNCKQSIIYGFDIGEKNILRGYCTFFFCANAFKLYKQVEYIFLKF